MGAVSSNVKEPSGKAGTRLFTFSSDIDWQHFFWFGKGLVANQWALMHPSAKAIYPIIAAHCDQQGIAFPGERRLAILAGRTDMVVRKGIRNLEDLGVIKVEPYVTRRGKRSKKFTLQLPSTNENGNAFPYFTCTLYAGNWSLLKPSAMAAYVAMRYWGFFDLDTYDEMEEESAEPVDFDDIFKTRKCDYCEADASAIAGMAGITIRSLPSALADLQDKFLVERTNGIYKVFLQPRKSWKASYMNQKIMEAYRREYVEESEKSVGHKTQSEKSVGHARKKVSKSRKKV